MAAVNPYMPPNAFVADVSTADSEAEAIRQEHIKHEASVRSIGVLYYIGGVMLLLGTLALIAASFAMPEDGAMVGVIGVLYGAFAALSIALGRGIRRLRAWATNNGNRSGCHWLARFSRGHAYQRLHSVPSPVGEGQACFRAGLRGYRRGDSAHQIPHVPARVVAGRTARRRDPRHCGRDHDSRR